MAKAAMSDVPAADAAESKKWGRSGTRRKSLADRARIFLLSAEGLSAAAIEEKLGVARITVYKSRERYTTGGLGAFGDRPRSGQPRKLDPKDARRILTMTTTTIPKEATHESFRLMAKYAGVTVHHVRQVWKAADLRPHRLHRLQTFKISNAPNFAEKVVDGVGLYMAPPDNAVVLRPSP